MNTPLIIATLSVIGTIAAMYAPLVKAHEAPTGWKYEAYCCNGNEHNGDCQKIPAARVRVTSVGYLVEIRPGDHRLATVHHLFTIPFAEVRTSQDENYHLCLYPNENTPRCFYAPPQSF